MVNFENICTENEISTADAVNTRYNIIKEYITAKIDDLVMKLLRLLDVLFLRHNRRINIQIKQKLSIKG